MNNKNTEEYGFIEEDNDSRELSKDEEKYLRKASMKGAIYGGIAGIIYSGIGEMIYNYECPMGHRLFRLGLGIGMFGVIGFFTGYQLGHKNIIEKSIINKLIPEKIMEKALNGDDALRYYESSIRLGISLEESPNCELWAKGYWEHEQIEKAKNRIRKKVDDFLSDRKI